MKKRFSSGINLVERYIASALNENETVKVIEKSSNQFKSIEKDIKEVGDIVFETNKYTIFTCTEEDRKAGANYRIGNKQGKTFVTRPVAIDIDNNTIKILKDDATWTDQLPIKSLNLKNLKAEARLAKHDSIMVTKYSKSREISEEEMEKRLMRMGYRRRYR